MTYSVVIPVFNENESLRSLHAELVGVLQRLKDPFEIIYVDDGSTDGSSDTLQSLVPATIISLRKNFGQTAALDAGIKHANGLYIITMDADGQNPPGEIPKLIKTMQSSEYDVVSGWRYKRSDPLGKRAISRGANVLRGIFVKDEIHDSGCSLKLFKRECFDGVDLNGEMHRFIPAVLRWSGFRIGEVQVEHRPRLYGQSKYTWKRIFKSFIDMISIWFWRKYATRPLHLFGGIGVLFICIGQLFWVYLLFKRFVLEVGISQSNLPLIGTLFVLLGFQFFISGLLADIAIRHYYSNGRSPYSIRNVVDNSKGK